MKGLILAGYEIQFEHHINHGRTICCVKLGDKIISKEEANCSEKDNYNRKEGRRISMDRALRSADLSKEERTNIWEAYRLLPRNSDGSIKPRWSKPSHKEKV